MQEFGWRQYIIEFCEFGHITDDALDPKRVLLEVQALDRHCALIVRDQPAEDLDRGALACTIGADIANDLAGIDVEVDALEDFFRSVGFMEIADRDDWGHGSIFYVILIQSTWAYPPFVLPYQ